MQGDEFVRDWVMPRLTRIGTPAFRKFLVDLMPFEAIAGMKEIVNVLHDTSVLIFETKKKALAAGDEAVENQIGKGKDIISILSECANVVSQHSLTPFCSEEKCFGVG